MPIYSAILTEPAFLVFYHKGENDTIGTPLNSYSSFSSRQEAEAHCSTQMTERSVEQRQKGVFFSVRQHTPRLAQT